MAKKKEAVKLGIAHQDWAKILEDTYGEIKGHHRGNQFINLFSNWTSIWPNIDLTGTAILLLENKSGRVNLFSNHMGRCPRFRLIDYKTSIALECHIRNHASGHYIHSIFLVELNEEKQTETTLIFDFDRTSDTIHTFNAQRMSELNQLLEN